MFGLVVLWLALLVLAAWAAYAIASRRQRRDK
jgi:hypothetical protein